MARLNVHLGPGRSASSSAAASPGRPPDKGGWGVAFEEGWCRGLKIRTIINPKMISRSRNIQLLLPVFFWYLNGAGARHESHDQEGLTEDYAEEFSLCCDIQVLNGLGHLNRRLFDIIFYAVQ